MIQQTFCLQDRRATKWFQQETKKQASSDHYYFKGTGSRTSSRCGRKGTMGWCQSGISLVPKMSHADAITEHSRVQGLPCAGVTLAAWPLSAAPALWDHPMGTGVCQPSYHPMALGSHSALPSCSKPLGHLRLSHHLYIGYGSRLNSEKIRPIFWFIIQTE